jgi:L-cysteine/cystine lyase
MPVVAARTYLDTASVGPVSRLYAEVLKNLTDEDSHSGRAHKERFDLIDQAKNRIRSEFASLLSATPEEFELTQGTTSGIRLLVERFSWSPGDEIVSTKLEFPRCLEPLREISRKRGLRLQLAEVPASNTGSLDWLERWMTPKTRLIVCSGVAYATGQKLPIGDIARLARDRGVCTLIDGAQLIGAAELDLSQAPIDFLAMPLQKWLGGPEGLGALYTRSGTLDRPRYDSAVHGWPVFEATAAHLAWLRDQLGWTWIHERTRELANYARKAINALDDDRLITPADFAGIVASRCVGQDPQALFDRLHRAGIIVRYRPEMALFRISTAFFNREDEIDRFVSAVQ